MEAKLIGERQRSEYAAFRLATFASRCRKSGLAVTPQRLAIIHALLATPEHPTAEAIYKIVRQEHPYVSLATIHRTLETLCEIGEARKVTPLHDSARYDGNVAPHHHVVCVRCCRIADIDLPDADRVLHGLAEIGEFRVIGTAVEFLALCKNCQAEAEQHYE